MHNKLPKIKELRALFIALKPDIMDDYASEGEEETPYPTMTVIIDWNPETGDWGYMTGHVDYYPGNYARPIMEPVTLYRRANSTELAREVRRQLDERVWDLP